MALPAAALPRWESRGQQALGEEQEGDEARARVFLPKTSLTHLPVYFFYQPSLPSSPEAAPHQRSNGDSSARPQPRVSPSLAPKPSPVPSCYAIPCQRVPEPAQRPPRHRLSFAPDPAARSTKPPPAILAFQRQQRDFFPASSLGEARARPVLLCKLTRGSASLGPAGDLYGLG